MSKTEPIAGQAQEHFSWLPWETLEREKWGWVLWVFCAVVVASLRFAEVPQPGNVSQIYLEAAVRWRHGEPLYNGQGTGFIYLPQSAVLLTPLSLLPFPWCTALWRMANLGVLAVGVWQFARLASRQSRRNMFVLLSVPVIALSWTSALHGQMTLAMEGLMLLAIVELVDRRWRRAATWLILGLVMKPLIAVLLLLALVLYPRTAVWLVAGMILAAALPFWTQRPTYVWEQYVASVQMLRDAAELGQDHPFAQWFWMLRSAGLEISAAWQTAIRIFAAGLTLALGWVFQKKYPRPQAGILLFTLAVGYLLLMSPRTERNTYCLLAPALAVLAAQAIVAGKPGRVALFVGLEILFVISRPLGFALTGDATVWIRPLLCAVFLAAALFCAWRDGPRLVRSCREESQHIEQASIAALPAGQRLS